MKAKKALVIGIAALMTANVAVFAGCGGGEDGDTDEIKRIRIWSHLSEAEDEGRVYSAIADSFNEQKMQTKDGRTIEVRLEFKNSKDALNTAISGEILTGGLPDVIAVDAPNIAAYTDQEVLVNFKEHITQESLNDYVDSVIEQGTIGDGLYALSGMDAPTGLYYNKTLLASVGYKEEDYGTVEDPWTWDDLHEAQVKLKQAGKVHKLDLNLGFGGSEGNMYLYSPLVYSAGGAFFGEGEKVVGALDSDKSIAGMRMLEKVFADDGEWYYDGSNEDSFPQEQVAFEIYGPWEIENIAKNYPDFEDDYDIMPMPVYVDATGSKGTVGAGCGSWCFGVTKDTRDVYAAAKVVEYFTSAYASELLFDSIGTFPTHKSSYESIDAFDSGASASLAEILVEAATPRPKMVNYPKLSDAFADCISYIQTKYGEADYDLKSRVQLQAKSVDA